jgi:g-D-glutamyl-meso-diaminopimelate peptidase
MVNGGEYMEVTVRLGDSLWYYSQLFSVPLPLLIDSNLEYTPNNLQIGDTIRIPGYDLESYRIKEGDTFWTLANKHSLPTDCLAIANPSYNPLNLPIGGILKLPRKVTNQVVTGNKEYHYDLLVEDIYNLKTLYPFIKVDSLGKSVLGKELFEIKIGNGPKKVHINGSFHANEWVTTGIIMQFLNDYLHALTNVRTVRGLYMFPFYHEVTLSIVPMVNPDGVDLVLKGPPEEEPYKTNVVTINNGNADFSNWKANIRGIDLNNQYPAYWEIEKERKEPKEPAPRDYPGDLPLSEPEAIVMAELTERSNFSRILAFHTQGKEMYWGYLNMEPPEAGLIAAEFERVSGYKAIQVIDSHAGFRDWFIYKWKKPGFTIELGEGVNPLPLSQFEEIYENSLGIFLASLYM